MRFRRALTIVLRACALAGALTACNLQHLTVDQTAAVLAEGTRAMDRETDLDLAAAAVPGALKTIESFLEAHPEQGTLLRLLADGYMSYAFGFIEDEAEAADADDPKKAEHLRGRALTLHLRARDFGIRLLALDHPELAATLAKAEMPSAEQLAAVDVDTLPGLFWTANPWGAAINVGKDKPALLSQLPIVQVLMERCAALDESYYHYGPRYTLGALAAAVPAALGGRPAAATQHFKQAIAATEGKHLMVRVLFGRGVGVQGADRALFERELRAVVEADPDADPSLALANRIAQRRARRYLAQVDDLFL